MSCELATRLDVSANQDRIISGTGESAPGSNSTRKHAEELTACPILPSKKARNASVSELGAELSVGGGRVDDPGASLGNLVHDELLHLESRQWNPHCTPHLRSSAVRILRHRRVGKEVAQRPTSLAEVVLVLRGPVLRCGGQLRRSSTRALS